MISILMPLKNEELYLESTISSIITQSESNFELIIIDDHSTDRSFKMLMAIAKKDNRIKILENPGSGIINALRHGQKYIKGNYITRQDADDLMPPDKLYKLKKLLKQNGTGHISTGNVKYFSDHGIKDGFLKYEKWLNELCYKNNHYDQIFKEAIIASSNWMMHTTDFFQIKGFADSIYPEDYHFIFKLFEYKIKIISSNEITHLWRDHPSRASRTLEQYKDQKFFDLKINYFVKFYGHSPVCLWGAGPTGKKLAKILIKYRIPFHWVTNNGNKIGKIIYDNNIYHYESLKKKRELPLLISVTERGGIDQITSYLAEINFKNYYEF